VYGVALIPMNDCTVNIVLWFFGASEVQRYWRSVVFSVQFHTSGTHRFAT